MAAFKNIMVLFVCGVIFVLAGSVYAEKSVGTLLEEATYQEETVGDVNAAIGIYEKVIADDEARRPETARATYRAGLCYLKKGDNSKAAQLFNDVITKFADQKVFAMKAQGELQKLGDSLTKPKLTEAPPKLEFGPWDEIGMRMKLTTPVGEDIGQMVWRSRKINLKGVPGWRIESFMNVSVQNMQQYTFVDALDKTYAPVASQNKNTMLGDFRAQYQADQVKLIRKADSNDVTKLISISSPVFDNEQALYVIRKMPLKEGYTGGFNIFPVTSGTVLQCKIEVLNGIETININSGPIACYKIKLNVLSQGTSILEHTLWISTDANRYLVKYDSGSALLEMIQPIIGMKTAAPDETGLQHGRISLPPEWVCLWSPKNGIQQSIQIMAPSLPFWAVLVKQPAGTDCNSVNEIAHKDSGKLIGFFKDYTPAEQSWTDLTISKMPATSYYATYEDKGKQMVEYRTYILNKPDVFWFVFRIEKDQFENYKPQFDSVINSFHDPNM